ncbi:MAG: response regulator [Deltaproteobacteria bacterium]|jgi:putative two-component system response regulator|nr:response regulator [Deltaproteobacteria bacterium]
MQHILIVDDNLTNLEQINIQLEDEFETSLAKSGSQALKISQKSIPDLILLDIEMPEMDGFDTFAELKANPALSHIPVIFLTASPDVKNELRAIKAGAADFVAKPVERDLLLHSVNTQLALAAAKTSRDELLREFEDKLLSSFADIIEHRYESEPKLSGRAARFVNILGNALLESGAYPEEISEKSVALMTRAAPLHDFGKIGIPDLILLKPSLLNDEEFAFMKTHTVIGETHLKRIFKILPSQDFHGYAIVMARSHHERWDGKGYPDCLKGEDIPLCARLMAVVDVFDALVDSRTYKQPMSAVEAFRTIKAGRGTFFDPLVADCFLSREEQITEALERDQDD